MYSKRYIYIYIYIYTQTYMVHQICPPTLFRTHKTKQQIKTQRIAFANWPGTCVGSFAYKHISTHAQTHAHTRTHTQTQTHTQTHTHTRIRICVCRYILWHGSCTYQNVQNDQWIGQKRPTFMKRDLWNSWLSLIDFVAAQIRQVCQKRPTDMKRDLCV